MSNIWVEALMRKQVRGRGSKRQPTGATTLYSAPARVLCSVIALVLALQRRGLDSRTC